MSPVLELDSVSKSYPGPPRVDALRSVDLTIDEGELVAVVGPSGSGKSTLLHIMGALDRPTSGRVSIGGRDVAALSDAELSAIRASQLGFVFQRFFLITGLSTVENVAQGLLYQGVPGAQRNRLAIEALERVGLGHRLRHVPQQLSGGELQRVAIARAVLGDPAILLADEPTGNLDSVTTQSIVELFHDLADVGSTIVLITHEREIAATFPRTVELRDGRIRDGAHP